MAVAALDYDAQVCEVKLDKLSMRSFWAAIIFMLALGYLKLLYPPPSVAVAQVIQSMTALNVFGAEELDTTKVRLTREFEWNAILGGGMIFLGLTLGWLVARARPTRARLCVTILVASLFLYAYFTSYLEFNSIESFADALTAKVDLLISVIRAARLSSKILALHEIGSILCVLMTLIVALIDLVPSTADASNPKS